MTVLTGDTGNVVPVIDLAATPFQRPNAIAAILLKFFGMAVVVTITGAWMMLLIRGAGWVVGRF
jgi:hypothetical protein